MGKTESDSAEERKALNGYKPVRNVRGKQVTFFAPSLKRYETSELRQGCDCTLYPVSITGSDCSLMCDHCHASILEAMPAAATPEKLFAIAAGRRSLGARGMLVSGGSDSRGRVPLAPFAGAMHRIRDELEMQVVVHTGITDAPLAEQLAEARTAAVMIDIIGSDATISDVCHLRDTGVVDYSRSLSCLCAAGLKVVPHVVIGLDRGTIVGELEALRMISAHAVEALVLVALRPLPGTPMAAVEPPSPDAMGEIFRHARALFPSTPVLLGCERPAGAHKEETDRLALEAGLDGIAYPADGIVALASSLGLETRLSGMCCALINDGYFGRGGLVLNKDSLAEIGGNTRGGDR